MSNRILDYPEATAITSDDYILLDNADTGAKCIKASALNINMDNYTIKEARGSIASFDDGEDLPLAFMGAYITAIQDLHGYDGPWVGGSGKNKLPLTVDNIKESNGGANTWNNNSKEINGITYTIQIDDNGNVIGINANGTATSNSIIYLMGTSSPQIELSGQSVIISLSGFNRIAYKDNSWHDIYSSSTEWTVTLNGAVSQIWGQITNGVTVNNIILKPMLRLSTETDATFAPYSNICPISGWDKVDVGVVGSNLIDITAMTPTYALNGITYTINSDGSVIANGTSTARSQVYWSIPQDIAKTFANKKLSGIKAHEGCSLFLELNETPYTNYGIDTGEGATINSSIENATTTVNFVIRIASGTTVSNYVVIPRITDELQTYTINLDGTRYGGTLDVVSGVLTVDKGYVDLGTLDWQYSSISERFYVGASDLGVKATDASTPFNAISSALIAKSYNEIEAKTVDYAIGINPNATQLFARYSSITSASDFITAMNGVQLVYELATPLTYQLSKQQIRSLVGVNNIFADTGDSIVDYRKLWVKPEM